MTKSVPRRRSTRTRRSPPQWWKEGSNRPKSKPSSVAKIERSSLSEEEERPRKRRPPRLPENAQPQKSRCQETFQSDWNGVEEDGEGEVSHQVIGDTCSTVIFHSTETYKSHGKPQSDFLKSSEHPVPDEKITNTGETLKSDIEQVTNTFESTAYHVQFTSTTEVETAAQTDKIHDEARLVSGNINTQKDVELTRTRMEKTCSFQVSSGLQRGGRGETIFNTFIQDGMCSSSPPRASGSNASKDAMKAVGEKKTGAIGKRLDSKDCLEACPEGRSTPPKASVNQNLSPQEIGARVVARISERLLYGETLNNENCRSPTRQSKPLSNNTSFTSAKDVRKGTDNSSVQSSRIINAINGVAVRQSTEHTSLHGSERYFGVEEMMPAVSQEFRMPETCSTCSPQACICENKRFAKKRAKETTPSAIGFKLRRGSKIHYTTESGVFGLIKFGIRACSDGILVGELTIFPRSATGPRRTSGQKELYIVLRGFLILEVEDSTLHLREGDDVEFEDNTVFQFRNPHLRSTDLICLLLPTEYA